MEGGRWRVGGERWRMERREVEGGKEGGGGWEVEGGRWRVGGGG